MEPSAKPPRTSHPIQAYLEQLHRRYAGLKDGAVATYIPELAKVDPDCFAIVIATVDGQVYEVGSSRQTFSIQSISKPLVYGVALEDCGRQAVEKRIGVEPTGDAFNSISLEPGSGRPLNPMVNAGAIAVASMVVDINATPAVDAPLARVLDALSTFAGRQLEIDHAVFESERETGHRNRAIGHMLRNYGIVAGNPEPPLELYFKQCSVLVDCRDLALIAATLANGGCHPLTGQQAVRSEFIECILSLMTTCGMYDYAGEWVYRVGMPAKSGVGGGVIAVLPGQLGIGIYSPRLDARGNSVRGVQVCEQMSSEMGLHFLQPPRPSASTVRARYTLASVRSKRGRMPAETRVLDKHGQRAAVFELQGDLRFATVEPVLREIADGEHSLDFAVLDFKRVTHVDAGAARMLARLVSCCGGRGQQLVLTRVRRGPLLAALDSELDPRFARTLVFQPQLDLGLEWCERGLLARHAAAAQALTEGSLAEHRLCSGASTLEVAELEKRVRRCPFDSGTAIVRRGDTADALYFLLRGQVSVVVELPQGGVKRLATLSAGMGFGESAVLNGGLRTADVRADSDVLCAVLDAAAFHRLRDECPGLMVTLLHNLLRSANETIGRLTTEIAALEA
jgi:glutaminase